MSEKRKRKIWAWIAAWLAEFAMRSYEKAGRIVVTEVGGGETIFKIRRQRGSA